MGVCVTHEGLPVANGLVPIFARGRKRFAAHIFNRLFIDGNKAASGTGFNRHIAKRHALFHRKRADGAAGKFNRAARAACGTDFADDGKRNVLTGDARAELTFHAHEHVAVFLRKKRLGGKHVLDFRGADPERERRAGAVGGRVAVAAHHGHAGERRALLGPHDVNDALTLIHEGEVGGTAVRVNVLVERFHLKARNRIGDAVHTLLPPRGGRIVIGRCHDRRNTPGFAVCQAQTFKGLGTCDLVHQVAVNVKRRRAVVFTVNDMFIPKFVVQCFCHGVFLFFVGLIRRSLRECPLFSGTQTEACAKGVSEGRLRSMHFRRKARKHSVSAGVFRLSKILKTT